MKKKILVIDDEPDISELLRIFMQGLGFDVDICRSFNNALGYLSRGHYWAVFSDYMMPEITGDRIFFRLKEISPDTACRFVMLTGAALDDKVDDLMENHGVKIIHKPFTLDDIKRILKELER
jgi:DNA-binding response OmpR family regulator